MIKTSEMNVVYGHHLDEKQSYIYEKTLLAKIATVPISDSRKMDVVQFCYYDTVLLSFHIYLTWIIKKILALCHSIQKNVIIGRAP